MASTDSSSVLLERAMSPSSASSSSSEQSLPSTKTSYPFSIKLHNDVEMPLVGIGTFRAKGPRLTSAIVTAVKNGVRLIDTAEGYKNAAEIKKALGDMKETVPREKLFIVSKVSKESMGSRGKVKAAIQAQLSALGVSQLDLILIHWPGTATNNPKSPLHKKARLEAWLELEEALSSGLTKSIGVSNFTVDHLKEIIDNEATKVVPHVNQIEVHPYLKQEDLQSYCKSNDIAIQAYTSLGRSTEPPKVLYGNKEPDHPRLVKDKVVLELSRSLKRSPEQLLLQWALEHNFSIIPKAVTEEHVLANAKCASYSRLDDQTMEKLDNLDVPADANGDAKGFIRYAYKPEKIPV